MKLTKKEFIEQINRLVHIAMESGGISVGDIIAVLESEKLALFYSVSKISSESFNESKLKKTYDKLKKKGYFK